MQKGRLGATRTILKKKDKSRLYIWENEKHSQPVFLEKEEAIQASGAAIVDFHFVILTTTPDFPEAKTANHKEFKNPSVSVAAVV